MAAYQAVGIGGEPAGHTAAVRISELGGKLANMIVLRTDVCAASEIIHAHPTYLEVMRATLGDAMGKAVDFCLQEA